MNEKNNESTSNTYLQKFIIFYKSLPYWSKGGILGFLTILVLIILAEITPRSQNEWFPYNTFEIILLVIGLPLFFTVGFILDSVLPSKYPFQVIWYGLLLIYGFLLGAGLCSIRKLFRQKL